MAGTKKLRVFYRAPTHAALWRMIEEDGSLENGCIIHREKVDA